MAKRLEVVLHDAGRIVDKVKGQSLGSGRYYVSLRGTDGEIAVTSKKPMEIQDTLELCSRLAQMSDEMAKKYLSRWEPATAGQET